MNVIKLVMPDNCKSSENGDENDEKLPIWNELFERRNSSEGISEKLRKCYIYIIAFQ